MRALSVVCALTMGVGAAYAEALWDARLDFSGESNPTGPWCYGTRATALGDDFSLLANSFVQPEGPTVFQGWRDNLNVSLGTPVVLSNTGSEAYVSGSLTVPVNALVMHPGPVGFGTNGFREFAVVRWIAPLSGFINVAGAFSGVDSNGDRDVYVTLNGQGIFSGFCDGGEVTPFSLNAVSVAEGDVLDFVVGNRGDFLFDSTGLDAVITVVPAPGAAALLGLGGLVAVRRRR